MRGEGAFPVRLRFAERGKVRFISHRDAARAFDRAFRIEALPLALSEGFSPRPKVSFGLALSVGHESIAEYMDVRFSEPVDLEALPARLTAALPEGIEVTGVALLADRAPALQESVTAVEWELEVAKMDESEVSVEEISLRLEALFETKSLPVNRIRKGREDIVDSRPALTRMSVIESGSVGIVLTAEIATQPAARPSEVVTVLGEDLRAVRVLRTAQWIERDGNRQEPLIADAARVSEARAS